MVTVNQIESTGHFVPKHIANASCLVPDRRHSPTNIICLQRESTRQPGTSKENHIWAHSSIHAIILDPIYKEWPATLKTVAK
jgi:hypothetical protein